MPKKELAPLKSTVNFDPEAELARIDAEITVIELRAAKLTRWALVAGITGLSVSVLTTLVFYLVYDRLVIWAGPAGLMGALIGGWFLVQSGKVRARAEFLMQQRRETRSLQKRAQLQAKG